MNPQRGALPTLTEVIDIATELLPPAATPAPLPAESMPIEPGVVPRSLAGTDLTMQVLETLRARVDALLEAHLHAALAPQLARLADDLAHALRADLSAAIEGLVAAAVDEVLSRRRRP